MKKNFWKIAIGCLLQLSLSFVVISLSDVSMATQKTNQTVKAELVWSQFDGHHWQILYNRFENNHWFGDIQITNNTSSDILPCIGKGPNGVTYIAWSVLDGTKSELYFSRFNGTVWTEPAAIDTPFTSNMAPSVFVTSDDVFWLVWAGFDGKVDNIYCTRRIGSIWDGAQKINADNSAPDILPVIGMNHKGNMWVYWLGYDGGGNYRNYASVWNGSEWEYETEEDSADNPYEAAIKSALKLLPDLPKSLTDPTKASIYLEGETQIQSLPLRYLDKKEGVLK